MAPIIESCNEDSVDRATLTGTGQGGLLSGGYLRDDPLAAYLGDEERPVLVRSNRKKGVTRSTADGDEHERIRPGDGYRAFALATDTRLLVVVGDTGDGDGDRSISVPLADVEVVDHSDGVLAGEFVVTTASDVQLYFPCRDGLDDVVEYLESASLAWMTVERRLDAARERVVDATQYVEARAYDDAMAAVRDAMAETDAARRSERELSADGVAAIATRVERMEERIADVRVRALEARAAHGIDRAEAHWRDGEYEAAHAEFTGAHDDYVNALSAGDHDIETSADLREKLARVERNVDALERAPVERAESARERAQEADDLGQRGDRLAYAIDCYRTALELDWGRSAKRFDGDTDELRARIDGAARALVEARRRLAAERVRSGDEHRDAGRPDRAAACYRAARDALAETTGPAGELVPDEHDALTDHLSAVEERLDGLESTDDGTPVPSRSD